MQNLTKILIKLLGLFSLCLMLWSCVPGGLKPGDARTMEMEGGKEQERILRKVKDGLKHSHDG